MLLHLILASATVMAAASTVVLVLVVVGIHRSEHSKRLTGAPAGCTEALAHRMLVGSRGCSSSDNAEGGQQ